MACSQICKDSITLFHICLYMLGIALNIMEIGIETDWPALVGVAQWIECWPVNQKVTGSIPHEGTCLG